MKTQGIDPEVFALAAEICGHKKTPKLDPYFRYGCNALKAAHYILHEKKRKGVAKNIKSVCTDEADRLLFGYETGESYRYVKFMKTWFRGARDTWDGFWGDPDIPCNQNARIIGLLLLAEIAKDEAKTKNK